MGMFKLVLRVQNLILITVIPAILLVVIVMASVLYLDLYNTILKGFDKKLFALGSSVASFIDGDEHLEINNMEQFRGVVYRNGNLYANTFAGVHLLKINLETGKIKKLPNEIGYEAIGGLTYIKKTDKIYGVTYEARELIEIDPVTGIGRLIGVLEHDVYGVAYNPISDKIFGNTYDELVLIDYIKGQSTSIFAFKDLDIQGITFHQGRIIAAETESGILYAVDPETASFKKMNEITHVSGEPILLGVFDLTSAGEKGLFIVTTVYPFKITEKGVATRVRISDADWQRRNDLYVRYVLPMIRLKEKKDATFLYTAILKDQAKSIYYNLDATQSSIHSFIGYSDPDTASEEIRDVWLKGYSHLSEISFWEEWGLLKSSYIPIKSKLGDIAGYAGADVNIDVINEKTKEMLIFIVLAGLLAIFIATLISLSMAKTLTQPIGTLKRAALKIASGSFGSDIPKGNINEITQLADSFNIFSHSLDSKISSITEEISKKEDIHTNQELINQLISEEPANLISKWTKNNVHIGTAHKLISNSNTNILLFWKIVDENISEIEKANISASIRLFVSIETSSKHVEDLVKQISLHFEKFLDYFGVININEEKLQFYSISNKSIRLAILDSETGEIQKTIAPSKNIDKGEFEKIKSSYYLLFGTANALGQLKKVKKEQLKNHSLTITMETVDKFLQINVQSGLATVA